MIAFYIWFVFWIWFVTNLHLYLICLLNVVGCEFMDQLDFLFPKGSVRIFLRHKMPETNKNCDSFSSNYVIFYSEKISDEKKRNKPLTIEDWRLKTWHKVNILDAGQICLFWRNIVVGSLNGLENLFSLCP